MQFHATVDKNVNNPTKDESMEVADLFLVLFSTLV
jgi:hypothetical protein